MAVSFINLQALAFVERLGLVLQALAVAPYQCPNSGCTGDSGHHQLCSSPSTLDHPRHRWSSCRFQPPRQALPALFALA